MKMFKLVLCSIITILVISACNTGNISGNKVQLRLNLEEGEHYDSEMIVQSKIEVSGMNVNSNMQFDVGMTVEEVNDDMFDISSTYDRIRISQDNPMMGKVSYDSDDPDASSDMMSGMYRDVFQNLIGSSINIIINDQGHIQEITGLEELLNNMGAGDQMSPAEMEQSYKQLFLKFPDEPVKVGDSWSEEIKMDIQVPMLARNTYTIKEITADSVFIDLKGNFETIQENPTVQGASITALQGDQTGVLVVDPITGWTLRSRAEQDFSMTVSQGGQEMVMKLNQEVITRMQ